MYLFIDNTGEIVRGSSTERTDVEVADDFFSVYTSNCWKVIDGVPVLKADADVIMAEQERVNLLEALQPTLDAKVADIDSNTAKAIVELAGDSIAQSNKLAKSSQLIRKEALNTITVEEKALLDYLDNLFVQVELLIAVGNENESLISNCTTQAEFDALCIELGV